MISVIIIVENVEKYLPVCINSVLKQTYHDFELICIDNASSDSSSDILEYYSNKDSRVTIIKNDFKMNVGHCLNQGLTVSKGEYISFLDGNSWFSLDTFELIVHQYEKKYPELILFKNVVYNENLHDFEIEELYNKNFFDNIGTSFFNHQSLDKNDLFSITSIFSNAFYSKSFLDDNKIQFSNENIFHINSFFFKTFFSSKKICFINKYLLTIRKYFEFDNIDKLIDLISYVDNLLDIFLQERQLYNYYKKELLTYIFVKQFEGTYNQIENSFKNRFFIEIQNACKKYFDYYGLFKDIKENVDENLLQFFCIDDIINNIINKNPKVSVIIPIYNVERYLDECLGSVCAQTFGNIEIICIDDGSTDNSLNILKKYKKSDSRIKIITQKNRGVSSARNIGLDTANGKYIYFLDSDDYLEVNAIKEMYEISEEKNLDMLIFKLMVLDDETNKKFTSPYWEMENLKNIVGNNIFNYDDVYYSVRGLFACTMQSNLFKKELIGNLRFMEGFIWEDDPFFIDNIFRAKRIYFYDKHLGVKRERKISLSHSSFDKFSDCIPTLNAQFEIYKKYGHFDEEFRFRLYEKKFFAIKLRFSQIPTKYKSNFFNLFKQDCIENKDKYEQDVSFKKLSNEFKNLFYAGLNSKDYVEFENKLNNG